MRKLEYSQPSISLEAQLTRLALEYAFIDNAVITLKSILPNLVSFVTNSKDNLNQLLDNDKQTLDLSNINKKYHDLLRVLFSIKFTDYQKTLVDVPEDFKGNLLVYGNYLINTVPGMYSSTSQLLNDYNIILTNFINENDTKNSLQSYNELFEKCKHDREVISEEISHFFGNKDRSKVYLKDVIDNFSQITNTLQVSNKLEKEYRQHNLKTIKSQLDHCIDLLNILIKNIKSDHSFSGQSVLNISRGVYEVAKHVEMLSLLHFKTNQFLTTFESLLDTLKKISK